MSHNSYLCDYIKDHKNWRKELADAPYLLTIKEEDNLAIFTYNMLAQKIEYDTTKIPTKWLDGRPVYYGSAQYEMASFLAPDNLLYENGATIKDYIVSGTKIDFKAYHCDFTIPEVQEARGIIIDTKRCEVACWPFRKFGNYGESYVDDIDWNSAKVQEKIDGSIIKIFYNKEKEKWQIATNGTIDAFNARTYLDEISFGELVEEALSKTHLKNLDNLDNFLNRDYTYIFELVSPKNRIVIEYPETKLYHTGTRSNVTGEEFNIDIGIDKPKAYNLTSLEDCIDAAEKLNKIAEDQKLAIQYEGFVVVDKDYHRIKIKSPDYLLIHHSFNNGVISKKRILKLIKENELEEYLTYFPQYRKILEEYKERYDNLFIEIYAYVDFAKELYKECNSVKEFALAISKDKYKMFAFDCVLGDKTIEEAINSLWDSKLLHYMGIDDNITKEKAKKINLEDER